MALISVLQTNFSGGEVSPHMHDRIDVEAYWASAARMRNFIPLPHGPMLRRRGSHFITEIIEKKVRLIPFTFNVNQSFVIQFTPGFISIYHDGGILIGTDGNPIRIASPIQNIEELQWSQNGDWLYLVNGINPPRALKRYSNTDWRVEELTFISKPTEWVDGNYPRTIAFYEQRAFYGGTARQPQQIWASRTGIYEDFTTFDLDTTGKEVILDDHALTYTIFSNDTNGIQWLLAATSLIVGTSGAEFTVSAASAIEAITPANIVIKLQTNYGSGSRVTDTGLAAIRPIIISTSVVFVDRSRRRVRSMDYTIYEDKYTATDLTIYASHIFSSQIKEMTVQSAPDKYIWCITEDGKLMGCTYEKAQKVLAWHTHETDGKYLSICILASDGNDVIYAAVQRGDKIFIETFTDPWEPAESIEEAFYVDSGLTYRGEPISRFTGLQHLEGRKVAALVDGWVHPDVVVENGSIALQQKGSIVHVGLPFVSEFLSLIPQSKEQLTVGMPRRILNAIVAVEDSIDFSYRAETATRWDIAFGGPTRVMNRAIPLRSEHIKINIENESGRTQQLYVMQNRPIPLIIRGILFNMTVNTL